MAHVTVMTFESLVLFFALEVLCSLFAAVPLLALLESSNSWGARVLDGTVTAAKGNGSPNPTLLTANAFVNVMKELHF